MKDLMKRHLMCILIFISFFAREIVGHTTLYAQTYTKTTIQQKVKQQFTTWDHLRGLATKDHVEIHWFDSHELKIFIQNRLHNHWSEHTRRGQERLLKIHHLIPLDMKYYELLVNLLTSSFKGVYDEYQKKLMLSKHLTPAHMEIVLRHESFHAWQDLNFNITSWLNPKQHTSDQLIAIQSLLEGDATLMMLWQNYGDITAQKEVFYRWQAQFKKGIISSLKTIKGQKVPKFIRAQLTAPYFLGIDWIYQMRAQGLMWKDINQIYDQLPQSTEQLLHIERYQEQDLPVHVYFNAQNFLKKLIHNNLINYTHLTSSDLVEWENVLGEWYWLQLLNTHLSHTQSKQATSGWGGDWTIVMDHFTCTLSYWDTIHDAKEFMNAFKIWYKNSYPYPLSTATPLHIQTKEQYVLFCLGIRSPQVLEYLWNTYLLSALE
jgi:hypothetical protein